MLFYFTFESACYDGHTKSFLLFFVRDAVGLLHPQPYDVTVLFSYFLFDFFFLIFGKYCRLLQHNPKDKKN